MQDSGHTSMINDTQFDYYGNLIASCDLAGSVRITQIEDEASDPYNQQQYVASSFALLIDEEAGL